MPAFEPTTQHVSPGTFRSEAPHALSLRGLLEAQTEASVARLIARRDVDIDPAKQLGRTEQAARGLAFLPRTALEGLGVAGREALAGLVSRPGWRARRDLGGGALALVEAGIAFVPREPMRSLDALALPAAHRLQMATPRAESRHAARALLAALDAETRDDVVAAFQGRRTSMAWPLALEPALLCLETPAELDRMLAMQDRDALLVLASIEARGGEVGVDEYLDLCREPARWNGARVPRRGVAFQLMSQALVLPSGEGRVVMPDEVAERVGVERRAVLERRRTRAIDETRHREDEPQRATLATPRGPRALAAWLECASPARPPPRAAISRAARRAATTFDQALLLVTLVDATPLRGHTLASYDTALLETWRAGHAWDELLETPRVASAGTLDTPTLVLRACALDALAALPPGRFAQRDAVRRAIESDLRFEGVSTAFARGRQRRDHGLVAEVSIAIDRLLDVSLPALGLVDVASDGSLRASPSGRSRATGVGERRAAIDWPAIDRARLSSGCPLEVLLAWNGTADAVAEGETLLVALDPARVPLDTRDRWLAAVERAGHPDVAALAERCVAPRASARAQRASWVVTIHDADLAAELRAVPEIARLLVSPHPEGPMLIAADGSPRAALVRALARAGVSVEVAPAAPAPSRRTRR